MTMYFQQTKLNNFGITWKQYVSSFKRLEFSRSSSSNLVSNEGAEILLTKPYIGIEFILDDSMIYSKTDKSE